MSLFHNNILAGASGGSDPTYVDDVFSTFLYDGNGGTQSINNGIDLSGEGGMVWLKRRNTANDHYIGDTVRGVGKVLLPNEDIAQLNATASSTFASFNSNGFTVGGNNGYNGSSDEMCSWTFRKCPGFFDVVTYTGNGTSGRTVAHSLGSVPGCIMVKRTSDSADWAVYHRANEGFFASDPVSNLHLHLNQTHTAQGASTYWNDTDPTSTVFTVGNSNDVNQNGETYVAYLFAHDDQSFGTDEDEAIIKCGSYTGTGSLLSVDLGFEPQWLLIKKTQTANATWVMWDTMRGFTASGVNDNFLKANENSSEGTYSSVGITPTGFQVESGDSNTNNNGDNVIYIAIRRPNKPPEDAGEVFEIDTRTGSNPSFISDFVVDMAWKRTVNSSYSTQIISRMTGTDFLYANNTNPATDDPGFVWDYMDGWAEDGSSNSNVYSWMLRRAPGFFDVVCYTGDGSSNRQITHNLKAVPEMAWLRNKDDNGGHWLVHHPAAGASSNGMFLNTNSGNTGSGIYSANPTSTTVQLGNVTNVNYGQNLSGKDYVLYLFASLNGISKLGSYSGSSSDVTVDCGFAPKFILIKRSDSSGNWMYFDTTRGIPSGSETGLYFNDSGTGDTYDYIDTTSSGFIVNSGGGVHTNENGGTFMFWAIAS